MSINLFDCAPGATNSLRDIPGVQVGHALTPAGDSGVTVIATPDGAVAGVDVRGGGPGTRETDLLDPFNTVQAVHAITLSGGSAFGLDAASGVMAELEARGVGFPVLGPDHPDKRVPIVPAAVIFDLLVGQWDSRPSAATGRAAARAAFLSDANSPVNGNLGAGMGAVAGALKGGFGQASAVFPAGPLEGVTIAAGIVTNPQGAVFDPDSGRLWGLASGLEGEFSPPEPTPDAAAALRGMNLLGTKRLNTTIGVVATNAALNKAECKRMALSGHDGIARAIRPAHMPMDGDTLFGLATGGVAAKVGPVEMSMISAVAAMVVERAIVHAILAAATAFGVDSYGDIVRSYQ